ncbi:cytochrome b [Sphingobium sp. DC-2]|uniref:cytochrome b n=1 Tax=Sphingobium sp. DC-2 TaxID=1303256 RepID=UPI0004C34C28|nr:cytochrome b [Sphingobium sp. DC-2]
MIEALRRWAATHTERSRYSPVGIAFHWIMAFLVMAQLAIGWYASILPSGGGKLLTYQLHSAVGLPILLLAIARLFWRLIIPGPVNDADRGGWQTQAAYLTHYIFYLCFFGLPLTGWVMWSALGEPAPLRLAGFIPWPALPLHGLGPEMQYRLLAIAEEGHHILVLLLALLIPLHVGAALKHHFWDRHDVLRGMLPEVPDWEDSRKETQHSPRESGLPQQ